MSMDERSEIFRKSRELREAGKDEEAMAMSKTCPLSPYLAKIAKEKLGVEYLRNSGWNLAEAEAEFGPNWLYR
jgi:hypothetical protein